MSLEQRLKALIQQQGPMTVAQYMTACLHDPEHGYYATRPQLGADGDFITAPMVSQMFGELIGLWCAEAWMRMRRPERVIFAEVGPGDGSLMSDALRALKLEPRFLRAAELWLVETSRPLRQRQSEALADAPLEPNWADHLGELPTDAPLILIANEVLDCLPVNQFVSTPRGWVMRVVGLDERGELAFGLDATPVPEQLPPGEPGAIVETASGQWGFATEAAGRIMGQGGVALLIDYGRSRPGFGDTFQALKRHKKVSPLETPGEADLTVHADFPTVLGAARAQGASAGLASQRRFLMGLGVVQRAEALARARPDHAETIARQLDRLIGEDQMGELFKVACLSSPGLNPPGFEAGA
jgi:SAM-dependent MidA family methyltransferase